MKYYFVKDTQDRRHIVVAKNNDDVERILKDAEIVSEYYYELREDTFDTIGFLISDN